MIFGVEEEYDLLTDKPELPLKDIGDYEYLGSGYIYKIDGNIQNSLSAYIDKSHGHFWRKTDRVQIWADIRKGYYKAIPLEKTPSIDDFINYLDREYKVIKK